MIKDFNCDQADTFIYEFCAPEQREDKSLSHMYHCGNDSTSNSVRINSFYWRKTLQKLWPPVESKSLKVIQIHTKLHWLCKLMNHMIIDWEFRFKFVGLSLKRHFALFLGYCLHFTICRRAQTCYQVYYELLHDLMLDHSCVCVPNQWWTWTPFYSGAIGW